jgi:hypothetical protein
MALVSALMVHARAGREGAAGFAQGRYVNHCNASVETFVPARLVIAQRRRPANPVGHRQPRERRSVGEESERSERSLSKEKALLDKKIKSICRGC